jgi:hypothetical protein
MDRPTPGVVWQGAACAIAAALIAAVCALLFGVTWLAAVALGAAVVVMIVATAMLVALRVTARADVPHTFEPLDASALPDFAAP